MVPWTTSRKIICSWPSQGTNETIYQDERGNTYREITDAEASIIRSSTAGQVYTLDHRARRVRP
jgi:hypothetical protein